MSPTSITVARSGNLATTTPPANSPSGEAATNSAPMQDIDGFARPFRSTLRDAESAEKFSELLPEYRLHVAPSFASASGTRSA